MTLDIKELEAMEDVSWIMAIDNANLNILCMEALSTNIRKKISLKNIQQVLLAQEANTTLVDIIQNKKKKQINNFENLNNFKYFKNNFQNNFEMSPRTKKIFDLEEEIKIYKKKKNY